jgi:hypothetical protein
MPEEAVAAVSRIPEGDRLALFERLASAWSSPLRRLHLVNLALRSSPSSDAAMEIVRNVLGRLYDGEAGLRDFSAFHSVLAFVYGELETWEDGRRWSADVRLAVTWAHASRLHGMLHGLGLSAQQILSMLESAGRSSFRESLVRDPKTWADSAHPRRFNRTRFLTHGVASMLAGVNPQVLEAAGVPALIKREALRVVGEDATFPESSLLSDPALHQDALSSLLGGDRHALLSRILGPEGTEILKSDNLKQVAKNYLEELIADSTKVINWSWIRVVTDDLPIYSDLAELCRRALETFDPFAARKDGFRAAWFVFHAAAYQAMNLSDEKLRQRYREHLVEMLRYEVSSGADDAPDAQFNSLRSRVGGLIEIASILSHVPNDPTASSREFTTLLEQMTEQWPDFSNNFRHIISREVWNLPVEEGESWWRLVLRMRSVK